MGTRWIVAVLMVWAGAWLAAGSTARGESKADKIRANMALARISMPDAIRLAEEQTGGKVYGIELKRDGDRIYYEVKLIIGDQTIKTRVDAVVNPYTQTQVLPRVPPPSGASAPRKSDQEAEQKRRAEQELQKAREQDKQALAREKQRTQREQEQDRQPANGQAQREKEQAERMREAAELPASPIVEPKAPAAASHAAAEGPLVLMPFTDDAADAAPAGFAPAQTGGVGKPASWRVLADATAPSKPNVVAVTENPNSGSTFSLLVAGPLAAKDLEVAVKVKALSGEDKGGGLVWRYQDENNYYVAAWDGAAGALDLWRVKDGRRKRLASAPVQADPGAWHEIRVEMTGDKITAYFDGRKVAGERDFTFSEPGKVGLWVKGDARAAFDDLAVVDMSGAK